MRIAKAIAVILILCVALICPGLNYKSAAESGEIEMRSSSAEIVIPVDKWYWRNTAGNDLGLSHITYGKNLFLAASSSKLYGSINGIDWTRLNCEWRGARLLTFANNKFFLGNDQGEIFISDDGKNWKEYKLKGLSGYEQINYITYAKGLYVGVDQSIFTSTDGITWTKRANEAADMICGVAYGNGVFTAMYSHGTILTSTNGIKWTKKDAPVKHAYFNNLHFVKDTFIALGDDDNILKSTNGVNWVVQHSETKKALIDATYGGGQYVVVGVAGTILTSTDCEKWVNRSLGTTSNFLGITSGNGTFVTVGTESAILQAGILPPSGLTSKFISPTSLKLSWRYNSDTITGFKIYQAKFGSTYECIGSVKPRERSFTCTGLATNTGYVYYVLACRGNYSSISSNCVKVKTQPDILDAPSDFKAQIKSKTSIELTWKDNSSNETSFRLYRKMGSGVYKLLKSLPANTTAYTDTGLTYGSTYSYKLVAENSGKLSKDIAVSIKLNFVISGG